MRTILGTGALAATVLSTAFLSSACGDVGDDSGERGQQVGDDDAMTGSSDEDVSATTPLDSDMAELTVEERLTRTLDGLADTVATIEESAGGMNDMTTDVMDDLEACGAVSPIDFDAAPAVADLDEAIRQISDTLKDEVFRDELVESDDGTTVVYYMDPSKVCAADDVECQQDLTDTEIRFSVTAHEDDSVRVVLQVGADRDEPATMVLTESSISATVDLAEVLRVMREVLPAENQDGLPDTLSGMLSWSIIKNADQNFSLEFGVIDTLSFAMAAGQTGQAVTGSLETSPDAFSMIIDGISNTIAVAVDWKALDLSVPGSEFCSVETDCGAAVGQPEVCTETSNCGAKEQNGTFRLHLDGVSMGTVLQDDATEIVIDNIGLGDTTSSVSLNADPLVEVDVNPSDNRRFSMQIQDTPDGALVTFEPKLDMRVAATLSNLSAKLQADLPGWLEDQIFDITFGGSPRAQVLVPDDCAEANHHFEVVEGTFTVSSSALQTPIEVAAGMCLVDLEVEGEELHPLETIAAGVCQ